MNRRWMAGWGPDDSSVMGPSQGTKDSFVVEHLAAPGARHSAIPAAHIPLVALPGPSGA